MGASSSCSCTPGASADPRVDANCVWNLSSLRRNIIFPNEILEKILSFLSPRDKLIAREVCTDWWAHVNSAGNLQQLVKIKVCSDELSQLAATPPVFTAFYFHKVDITRQSISFWNSYSDVITHLDFNDCSIIPRNTLDSKQPNFTLGCPNLKYLGLVNCDKYFLMGGTFIQLHEILCLEHLETLNLSQNKNLSDSILFSILLKTRGLQKLDLSDCINMVFMKAVHNRFYPAGRPRPPYSDHVLSFHTLCTDFLQTSRASKMTSFNFGMKFNSTGMSLLLSNDQVHWKRANLESPELKTADITQFLAKFHASLQQIDLGRCKLTAEDLFSGNLTSLHLLSIYDSRNITSLTFLPTMPNLRTLVLDGTSDFELNSDSFKSLVNLEQLSLNGIKPRDNPEQCRSELIKIFKDHPKLISLDIGNCPLIVNDSVVDGVIKHLRNLKQLNLEASSISEVGLEMESGSNGEGSRTCLSQLEDIQHLNLSHCRDLHELTWQLTVPLPNLISLNLKNCNTLSKRGILSIIDNCRSLEKLTLMHCSSQILTDPEVVSTAREKLYRCKGIIY